jgi:hypothetical protein
VEALAGKKEAGEKFTRLNARNGLSRDCQSSTVRYGYATILLPLIRQRECVVHNISE